MSCQIRSGVSGQCECDVSPSQVRDFLKRVESGEDCGKVSFSFPDRHLIVRFRYSGKYNYSYHENLWDPEKKLTEVEAFAMVNKYVS